MVFGWFRRRKRQPSTSAATPTPKSPGAAAGEHWAPFLTLAQQQRLEQLVVARFAARGIAVVLEPGAVRAGDHTYGLDNLARSCRPLPPDEWSLRVDEHFAALDAAADEEHEWERRKQDFGWVAPQLRLRLYPPDFMPDRAMTVHRVDLEHTCSVLVIDLPRAVATVSPDLLPSWGRSVDEVLQLALEQTLRECAIEWELVDLGGGAAPLHLAAADHFFVATHALRLSPRPELLGRHGTMVAVPDRHTLLALPLQDAAALVTLNRMIGLAFDRCAKGVGSLSPQLYWLRPDGTYQVQCSELANGKLLFLPTPELVAALDQLAASR